MLKRARQLIENLARQKVISQKTAKVTFQAKEESSDDSVDSDDSEDESSDNSDEQSHTQVGWSWHQDSEIILSEDK